MLRTVQKTPKEYRAWVRMFTLVPVRSFALCAQLT